MISAALLGGIIAAVGSMAATAASTAANVYSTNKTNETNLDIQRQAWEKQSITNRVAELEANGLNKQLATGVNPNYSVSASMQSPDYSGLNQIGNAFGKASDFASSIYDMGKTKVDTENARLNNAILGVQKSIAEANLRSARAKASVDAHDAAILIGRPTASSDPSAAKLPNAFKDMFFGNEASQGQGLGSWILDSVKAGGAKVGEMFKNSTDKVKSTRENKEALGQSYNDSWRSTDSDIGRLNAMKQYGNYR